MAGTARAWPGQNSSQKLSASFIWAIENLAFGPFSNVFSGMLGLELEMVLLGVPTLHAAT